MWTVPTRILKCRILLQRWSKLLPPSIDLFENVLLSFRRTKCGTLEHLQLHTFKFCINPGLCSHAQMAAHMYQEPLLQTVYKTIQQFNSLQTKAQQTWKQIKHTGTGKSGSVKKPFVFSAWQRQAPKIRSGLAKPFSQVITTQVACTQQSKEALHEFGHNAHKAWQTGDEFNDLGCPNHLCNRDISRPRICVCTSRLYNYGVESSECWSPLHGDFAGLLQFRHSLGFFQKLNMDQQCLHEHESSRATGRIHWQQLPHRWLPQGRREVHSAGAFGSSKHAPLGTSSALAPPPLPTLIG